MRIRDILREQQPGMYSDIYSKIEKPFERKEEIKHKEKLSEKDIKELMKHDHYRRGKNGAIKQVNS